MTTCEKFEPAVWNDEKRTYWRIDEIIDTRDIDYDTGKPIPGTGESAECQCCGKKIMVHAHVYLFDCDIKQVIHRAVIGTDCCKKHAVTGVDFQANNKNYWKRRFVMNRR